MLFPHKQNSRIIPKKKTLMLFLMKESSKLMELIVSALKKPSTSPTPYKFFSPRHIHSSDILEFNHGDGIINLLKYVH